MLKCPRSSYNPFKKEEKLSRNVNAALISIFINVHGNINLIENRYFCCKVLSKHWSNYKKSKHPKEQTFLQISCLQNHIFPKTKTGSTHISCLGRGQGGVGRGRGVASMLRPASRNEEVQLISSWWLSSPLPSLACPSLSASSGGASPP